jgi:hypothetical protein
MKKSIVIGVVLLGLLAAAGVRFIKQTAKPLSKDTVTIIEEAKKQAIAIDSKPEPVQVVNDIHTNPVVPADIIQGVGINYNWKSR